jgi:glutaryl-CoA dehydrogenase
LPSLGSNGRAWPWTKVPALAQDIGLARQTDYFLMKDQLTEDEPGLLHRVRKFAETEVLPVVNSYR